MMGFVHRPNGPGSRARAAGIGLAVSGLLAAGAIGLAPAEASFAVAKDDRAKAEKQPPSERPGRKRRPAPRPQAPAEAPVVAAPEVPALPPPPEPRPSWPAPAGWTVTQASTVCTLQRLPGGEIGALRMIDWKPRDATAAERAAGVDAPSRAEVQLDLKAPPRPSKSGGPPAITLEVGKAVFGLIPRGPQGAAAAFTPELRAALDKGGKARLIVGRKPVAKFTVAEGRAALEAFDACMDNARQQPLPVVSGTAAQ